MSDEQNPLSPLRRIERHILELDRVPLFGRAPALPVEQLTAELQNRFGLANLEITLDTPTWREPGTLYAALGQNPQLIPVVCSPLPSAITWAISEQDLLYLFQALTHTEVSVATDNTVLAGFARFVAVEIMDCCQQSDYPSDLTLRLSSQTESPASSLTVDVSAKIANQTITSRLILPDAFLAGWRSHFATQPARLNREIAAQIETNLSVDVGRVEISSKEWRQVRVGDFIVLDSCSITPESRTGSATLTLEGHPLFNADLSPTGVEITEQLTSS